MISVPNYSFKKYWDHRYQASTKEFHEWYFDADAFMSIAQQSLEDGTVDDKSKVLEIGCGNSKLAESLAVKYKTTAIDFSAYAIELRKKNLPFTEEQLNYVCADARKTNFESETFAAVIDKATLDAMDCDEEEKANFNVSETVKEMYRILKPNGYFIVGTCRAVEERRKAFQSAAWKEIACIEVPKKNGNTTPDKQYILTFRKIK
eukprot:g5938.t1